MHIPGAISQEGGVISQDEEIRTHCGTECSWKLTSPLTCWSSHTHSTSIDLRERDLEAIRDGDTHSHAHTLTHTHSLSCRLCEVVPRLEGGPEDMY